MITISCVFIFFSERKHNDLLKILSFIDSKGMFANPKLKKKKKNSSFKNF